MRSFGGPKNIRVVWERAVHSYAHTSVHTYKYMEVYSMCVCAFHDSFFVVIVGFLC